MVSNLVSLLLSYRSEVAELDKRCSVRQEQVHERKEALAIAERGLEEALAERAAFGAERAK
eukprot:1769359-Pyramimonas_sp.AAC.1